MPAVAKKSSAPKPMAKAEKKPKKQTLKKTLKTEQIKAAKKLDKLKAKKAISDKLNRTPVVQKQKSKHQFNPIKLNRGVVLVQNLPRGFFEEQLQKYFSQYGQVTRLRLARSERTGQSKAYAFIEFKYPAVAEVAAQSINNYLMFRHVLKTVYIPPNEQKYNYFKQPVKFLKLKDGTEKLVTPKTIRVAKAVALINKPISNKRHADLVERSKYKLQFLQKKLEKAGINVDLSSAQYSSDVKPSKKEKKAKAEKTPAKKTETKKETAKNAATIAKKEKAAKKSPSTNDKKNAKDNADSTLENLLEKTINSSDEESDDDDYTPSAEEIAEADAFVNSLLNEESDGEDADENDTSLNKFLNNTIDSDDNESDDNDDDYQPTEAEIQKAKLVAQTAAKKLSKIDTNKFVAKKVAVAEPKTALKKAIVQKPKPSEKRKLVQNETINVVKKAEEEPRQKKKKANPKAAVVNEPVTPPPSAKTRKNFVSAPTPTPEPAKNLRKSKVQSATAVAPKVNLPKNEKKINSKTVPTTTTLPVNAKQSKKSKVQKLAYLTKNGNAPATAPATAPAAAANAGGKKKPVAANVLKQKPTATKPTKSNIAMRKNVGKSINKTTAKKAAK